MRVVINGVSVLKPKTGVGHTTAHLHRALTESQPADSFWLYPGETLGWVARRVFRPLTRTAAPSGLSPRGEVKNSIHGTERRSPLRMPVFPLSPGGEGGSPHSGEPGEGAFHPRRWKSRLIELAKTAYRVHFRAVSRWGNFDLYHEPNFVPIRAHLPTVVTVHDLSVLLYSQWHPAERVRFHDRHFRAGVAAADHVIVVSESVRREAIRVLGLPPGRVTAVHNGIGDAYRPQLPESVEVIRRKYHLPPLYLLAVGTIEPRKNVGTLLQAFCDLPAVVREYCPLVLAGGWGWKSHPERELFEAEARHRGAIHLGYVDDGDLPGLYAGAAALLYPSFYEGFGLPPVEMLACGGGVIASTADAVREVVGSHAILIDPLDLDGWREAMWRAATDPDFLAESCRGGIAHARRFTWSRAAAQTFDVYRHVLGIAEPATHEHRSAAA